MKEKEGGGRERKKRGTREGPRDGGSKIQVVAMILCLDEISLCFLVEVSSLETRDWNTVNLIAAGGNYKLTSWVTRVYGDRGYCYTYSLGPINVRPH